MSNKKRGQVAIFMILAIIILLLGAFFIFSDKAALQPPESINPEILPVKNFVESCIVNTATQGIKILGANGGYITFPEVIDNNPRSYLQIGPPGKIKNPYWWYEGIENIPPESFIKKQIEDYITSEMSTCLTNFESFGNQFDINPLGEIITKITLNQDDVTVNIDYPIELINKLNRTIIRLDSFEQTVPIRLKKVYEAARDVMEAEKRDLFLEFKTVDLITLDESIPTTDFKITCEQKVWQLNKIENKLKRLLNVNLPYINVIGSDFDDNIFVPNPFGEDTYKQSYYNAHYKWKLTEKSYDNLKFSFDYDQKWPFNLIAWPSSNGLLKSNAQKSQALLDFLCLHLWHFTYDIDYPVRTTITDFNGLEPYQFIFAFKVKVNHNQPSRQNLASTLIEQPDIADEEEFCSDVVNDITVFTQTDSLDPIDIAKVNLTYTCGIFTCNIGQTDWISFGAAAGLTAQYPYCVNGILRASKQGFEDKEMFIQTETPSENTISLRPIKDFVNYEIIKHDFDFPPKTLSLNEEDIATISIESTTTDFKSFGVYPDAEGLPIKLLNDDHEYEITIYLSNKENIIGGFKGTWKVSASALDNAEKIRFHVLEKEGIQDLLANLESKSTQISKPELI